MNSFIIGDIHGEITQLKELLNKINYDGSQNLYFLGDYIDRGEDSFKTYMFIKKLKKENPNIVLIRGNHEQMLIDAVLNKEIDHNLYSKENAMIIWQQNGGAKTFRDFKEDMGKLIKAAEWFDTLPYIHETEDYILVHAGVDPNKRLYEQDKSDFIWIRNKFIFAEKLKVNKIVVAGHTPFDKPRVLGNKVLLDTGAGKSGYLTAMDIKNGQFISLN